MREFTIGKNDAGQRLDRFVSKNLPLLPPALLQKYIRIKRIKVNGKGARRDDRLNAGDVLQLYINDEFFDKPNEENLFLTVFRPQLNIVYEDENLLLVDKRPGLVVHADETEKVNTLINHIQAYLYQKKEWNPRWENAFAPALCNRIDRNTGGIVIAAKNAETLRIINEKIRDHELEKSYLCVAVGRPRPAEGRIEGFLLKDEAKKLVSFYYRPVPGGKTAVTLYKTLETRGELSLVECRLLTGRTHQIRVSMAEIGCPLLGDGKYGNGAVNKRYHETRQALYSYKLHFDLPTDAGLLNYLRGRAFTVADIPFRDKYFPQK
nr:RluA family pseudouridine synthase [uncultured Oscillibacter sp.]